jgi:hypothetical protein
MQVIFNDKEIRAKKEKFKKMAIDEIESVFVGSNEEVSNRLMSGIEFNIKIKTFPK